jgi:hypothetical protein
MKEASHSTHSSLREKVIEHLFVGQLLRHLWQQGARDMEVLRAEVDGAGYDFAIECDGVLRHVQLKASHHGASTREVSINAKLAKKPNGCVIWIHFDPGTLELGPYLWFGGKTKTPLPNLGNRLGRHSRANARGQKRTRPAIRRLEKRRFSRLDTVADVAAALFGNASPSQ